jgi:small subunit ribosomal protein S6
MRAALRQRIRIEPTADQDPVWVRFSPRAGPGAATEAAIVPGRLDPSPREYELVLMLDPGLEDATREKLAQDARTQIESGGTLRQENTWGLRKLAYEIGQRTEADYRWFRFQAERELLDRLDHNLKIADGVLRFRIFKADPQAPVVEAPTAGGAPPARTGAPDRGGPERDSAPEEPGEE